MAARLTTGSVRGLAAAAILVLLGMVGFLAYDRYRERYAVTAQDAGSGAVTQLVTARLAGASSLKVAQLSGTVQSTSSDVRGFGWLRSDQLVKMPYSVDYFVDVSRIGPAQVEWNAAARTLIVDAPEVTVAAPNTDEGQRTLVRTTGIFVTRRAGEELSQRTSIAAAAKARAEAGSPERMAQAREFARQALSRLLSVPLRSLGHGDARVIVTFPLERQRANGERWDMSRSVGEVLTNAH